MGVQPLAAVEDDQSTGVDTAADPDPMGSHDGRPDPEGPGVDRGAADPDRTEPGDGDGSGPGPLETIDSGTHPAREWVEWGGLMVAVLCGVAVFVAMGPNLIFADTTATGGDMGAHVWGPAYLRDVLLPNLRVTGWTPDWYGGFPAYTFYMVVPSLFIVWLDVGLTWWLGIPLAAGVVAGTYVLFGKLRTRLSQILLVVAAVFLVGLLVGIPYNVAFKLVAVSGLVTLPLAAYTLGRAARLAFPIPPLLALGATMYLFENGFSILGGNILSTMAGEFAFSISLTFAVFYLAALFKGIETGRYRALGAVLFGLTIACHLIPAIFAAVATVVIVLVRREDRTPWWDGGWGSGRFGRVAGAALVAIVLVQLWLVPGGFPVLATVAALLMLAGFDLRALRWSAVAAPVGFLLAAFWFIPFFLNSAFLNDMGWEKYTNYADYLWPQPEQFDMANRNLWFALAGAGIVLSLVHRIRLGWFLTMTLVAFGWLFVFLPQYRLWNARLLPFYYLCLYLLAALGVALVIRAVAVVLGDLLGMRREPAYVGVTGMVLVGLVALVYVSGSLQALPGGGPGQRTLADGEVITTYEWGPLRFQDLNNASNWARYNFAGLEDPAKAYDEYSSMIAMMDQVGRDNGCGRTMWEYESELNRFGTPMAPMMLPYFTDGCIGSMEGLYFEASSTTPFHFINQSELSPSPSRPQRDLPYPEFDVDAGVRHLQLMGVRYYLAATDQAVDAARLSPELTEIASTAEFPQADGSVRQWVVFEVADAPLVESLENLPVVLTPTDDHIDGWVYDEERPAATEEDPNPKKTSGPAMDWYLDPSRWDVPLATSGPPEWPRVDRADEAAVADPPREPVDPVTVSEIETTDDQISFKVSEPGTPVLVKTSFFPNWDAHGADGPYRVSPNFMVVVPTGTEVTLTYGRTAVEWLGWLMTAIGIGAVIWLARRDGAGEQLPSTDPGPAADADDPLVR